jgi:hypothetical protein
MEDDGIFYGQLVHFMVFCYCILRTFGIVRDILVFFPFWYFYQKNLATLLQRISSRNRSLYCRLTQLHTTCMHACM